LTREKEKGAWLKKAHLNHISSVFLLKIFKNAKIRQVVSIMFYVYRFNYLEEFLKKLMEISEEGY